MRRASASASGLRQVLPVQTKRMFTGLRVTEKVGDALGFLERRVSGDLERFKKFVESRGAATGAWRGEIHGAQVDKGPSTTRR